jgi:hypothetical protein
MKIEDRKAVISKAIPLLMKVSDDCFAEIAGAILQIASDDIAFWKNMGSGAERQVKAWEISQNAINHAMRVNKSQQ